MSSKDVELTTVWANSSIDVDVDIYGLDKANNIAKKEAKICESNIF